LNGKEAIKINYSGKKAHSVSFSDGSEIEADYLVLTADPAAVFGKILDAPMPQQLKKLYDDPRLQRFSSFHCAFSCDLSLLPFRGDFVFSISEPYQKALRTNTLVLREFSHEKGFSPEGKTVLQALCFCKEDFAKEFINLREESRKDYLKIKQNIAEIFKKLIIAKIPQLSDSLRLIDVWTPASYRRFTNSEAGTFMSFTLPSKYLPTRKSNRIAGLSNVILATQWQQIPGGLPIAAEGGRLAIETINKLEEKVLSRKTVKRNIVPDEAKAR
jgi:phytoene dehydrogenase-like protein